MLVNGLRALLICAALIATGTAPLVGQSSSTLSPREIDEAIDWGLTGRAAPYLLHGAAETAGKVGSEIDGAIYTPFLRVALAAKAARDAGGTFAQADVSPSLIKPLAYVAFRWYCCDPSHGDDLASFHPLTPFNYRIATPGERWLSRMPWQIKSTPQWISRDISLLASFGGQLPYADVVLIAAYPMDGFVASQDFVIYVELASTKVPLGVNKIIHVSRVPLEDLKRLR